MIVVAKDETYNGWTNYATWGVALVLDNDEGTYNEVREQVADLKTQVAGIDDATSNIGTADEQLNYLLSEWLKDFTEELCGLEDSSEQGLSMMARQVLQAGLAEVNWDEIADNILSEDS
jgi:hypothetical protein